MQSIGRGLATCITRQRLGLARSGLKRQTGQLSESSQFNNVVPIHHNQSTHGLVAMTSASHAEGRQFDPGWVYSTKTPRRAPHTLGNQWVCPCLGDHECGPAPLRHDSAAAHNRHDCFLLRNIRVAHRGASYLYIPLMHDPQSIHGLVAMTSA